MTPSSDREPPSEVTLTLDEALELVGVLEDARDALFSTDHLVEVPLVSAGQLVRINRRRINRRLGFPDIEGGEDGS